MKCVAGLERNWAARTAFSFWMAAGFQKRAHILSAPNGNGVGAWARKSSVKSANFSSTRPRALSPWRTANCICPRTGHSTESAAKLATSRKRWSFKRGGSWPRKWCWAVGKCCLTVGSWGTRIMADRRSFGTCYTRRKNVTCSKYPRLQKSGFHEEAVGWERWIGRTDCRASGESSCLHQAAQRTRTRGGIAGGAEPARQQKLDLFGVGYPRFPQGVGTGRQLPPWNRASAESGQGRRRAG